MSKTGLKLALIYLVVWLAAVLFSSVSTAELRGLVPVLLTLPWTPLCVAVGDSLILDYGFRDTQFLWNVLLFLGALGNAIVIYGIAWLVRFARKKRAST